MRYVHWIHSYKEGRGAVSDLVSALGAQMNTPADLQTVLVQHLERYKQTHGLSARERQVCEHIKYCRTPAMGGVRLQCSQCEYSAPQYHACRDRHCPKCQRLVSKQWCERQREYLLPVTYHHLVFTLPSSLNGWISQYPKLIYHQLFQCAWQTLKTMGADPKRLNGQMGLTAVLHTWGENLSRHVHLHCLVPGGALGDDDQWHNARSEYLFPVRALSRLFRGKMVSALRQAGNNGVLSATSNQQVKQQLDELMSKQWVVYSKPCPAKVRTVVDYLGRYSHRIAISDERIVAVTDNDVRFSAKNYRDGGTRSELTLTAEEFIRRYLLHVLPKGLMRIRHYGFLSNRCRQSKFPILNKAIARRSISDEKQENDKPNEQQQWLCPNCKQGHLHKANLIAMRRLTEG